MKLLFLPLTLITQLIFTQLRPPCNPGIGITQAKKREQPILSVLATPAPAPRFHPLSRMLLRLLLVKEQYPTKTHVHMHMYTLYTHKDPTWLHIYMCVIRVTRAQVVSFPSLLSMATDSTPFLNQTSHTHATNHKQDLTLSYTEDKQVRRSEFYC